MPLPRNAAAVSRGRADGDELPEGIAKNRRVRRQYTPEGKSETAVGSPHPKPAKPQKLGRPTDLTRTPGIAGTARSSMPQRQTDLIPSRQACG
jgi:hypothetical protein